MAEKRNEPCPCGSGKKYKACCAGKRKPSQRIALASVVVFALLAVWVLAGIVRRAALPIEEQAPPGKVWSEEHGHWHDAPGSPGTPQPPGPTPPGKEWSSDHGHWHDAATPGAPPPGPAPPGKVWSAEHGHWHDVDGAEPVYDEPVEPIADPALGVSDAEGP